MADSLPVESLWDANDVARFLKVSRSWVYQKTAASELPCLHVGGLVRFEPETIRAWARGEHSPSARIVPLSRKPKL
ncbi:helix-turn-helix domain-containing protein [Stigmatella hybrida]|uniref:helix-turn-helix domain-containing protein n=1 Tax=Stigmatella hybrida TaxID=394097 RepID=UPI001CDA742A|nr:helix-turn-helix domain-containing protein [Stigmatella hybrida]